MRLHTKFKPSWSVDSEDCNINVCSDMLGQWWLFGLHKYSGYRRVWLTSLVAPEEIGSLEAQITCSKIMIKLEAKLK